MNEDFDEALEINDNPYISIDRKKSCVGKNIWVYKLSCNIDKNFLDNLIDESVLSYPLGEKYGFFQIQSKGKYVIRGIINTNEIKLVPRLDAGYQVRLNIEKKLTELCKNDLTTNNSI